jgi:hypothetical protein
VQVKLQNADIKMQNAPGRTASAGGCQKLGDLRTEAAERNNVAKTTILHACRLTMSSGV